MASDKSDSQKTLRSAQVATSEGGEHGRTSPRRSRWWLWILASVLLLGFAALVLLWVSRGAAYNPLDGAAMVYVPPGQFIMGRDEADDQAPQRSVDLAGYWIYRHPVTVGQYRTFCQSTGRDMPSTDLEDEDPMLGVTWHQAMAYARWAGMDLPTEAQWEKAMRGTDGRRYRWGNEEGLSHDLGSISADTKRLSRNWRKASPFGVHEGSALDEGEWCADWYAKDYYQHAPTRDPKGPGSGEARVVRGGQWHAAGDLMSCADRSSAIPTTWHRVYQPDLVSLGYGFRCASAQPPGDSRQPQSGAGPEVQLRLRLHKGLSRSLRMAMSQDISQTLPGQGEVEMTQTLGLGYRYDVTEVGPDGAATLRVSYPSVSFAQQGPMGETRYDSAQPGTMVPDQAKGFAALVGQSFSARVSSDGRVREIRGADAMITRIVSRLGLPAGPGRTSMENTMREQFGDEALRDMMAKLFDIFPDGAVAPGDSWHKRVAISKGFPMILDTTWTLEVRANGTSIIGVQSTIAPNPEAPPVVIASLTLSYDVSGEQRGIIHVDDATGLVQQGEFTQEFSGTVRVEGGPSSLGRSWPISARSTVTLRPFGP